MPQKKNNNKTNKKTQTNHQDQKSLMASFPLRPSAVYYNQGLFDDCPAARVEKARSQQEQASRSLYVNWTTPLLAVLYLTLQPLHTESKHALRESWQEPQRITK